MNDRIAENDWIITGFHRVIQSYILWRRPGAFGSSGRQQDGLICILEGACTYTFRDGKHLVARAGDVLYLSRGAVYQMEVRERYEFIFCDFDLEPSAAGGSCVITPRRPGEIAGLFRKLKHSYEAGGRAARALCMENLYRICAALIQEGQPAYVGADSRRRIENAREWMDTHVSDRELTIGQLAEQAGMSEVYFRKLFGEIYGLSPIRYLQSARIAYAGELLRAGFLTLEEVALQSGFASTPYFCRAFKRITGQSPAAWRRQQNLSGREI